MKNWIIALAILAILFVCCHHGHEHKSHDIHNAQEPSTIQLTAYSDDFEVFAEADAFVVGEQSNILSHFSHLPSFTALTQGSMTVHLLVKDQEVTQTLDEPTRRGIYSFDITPEDTGRGRIEFNIKTEKGAFNLKIPNVFVYATRKEADDAASKLAPSLTNATVFTKEQSWRIDFATQHPSVEPFGQIIKATAQVQSAQGDEILISAKTNGVVMLSTDNVLEGKRVSAGQTLLSISGSDLADNNISVRHAEAKNNFEKETASYDRIKELAKDNIVSQKDLLNAKNKFDNAKVVYDNLSANFSQSGQRVTSSLDGYVKQVFVQNGQHVEAGQPIVIVSQNRSLLLRTEVQQKFASVLGSITSANIRTPHDNKAYTLAQLNGRILSSGLNTNNDNFLIPISLQIDNKGTFVSGGFVELFLKTTTNQKAITIPNSAVLEEQGIYFVYVQVTPELFEKRAVQLGETDGLKYEIIKGVTSDDRIVTIGAMLVKLAQATGALDPHSGHNH